MRVNLVQIGGSKGIRIPKTILQQCEVTNDFEMKIENRKIILEPVKTPRKGWEEAFAKSENKKNLLELEPISNKFDAEEWEW